MARVRHKRRDALVLYPHHRKPYRVHHLASLLVMLALVLACVFEIGVVVGRERQAAPPVTSPSSAPASTTVTVRSGYGFSFKADSGTFTISGTELGSDGQTRPVTGSGLASGLPLTAATVQAKPGALQGRLAATRFSVRVNPDASALTDAEHQPGNAGQTPQQIAAKLFPVNGGSAVSTRRLSSDKDTLDGVQVQKTVYEFTGSYGGKSYAVQWSGTIKGRAFAVELDGLAGSQTVPGEFAVILNSLDLSAGQAVLGADTNSSVFAKPASASGKLDAKYLSDALSPGVVQIFHTVCGILTIGDQELGGSNCVSFGGSGFLVTTNGYIATNGHVVVYTAKDELADLLTSNKAVLESYLKGLGLSPAEVSAVESNPAAIAALIAKVYDLPDSQLHFTDEGDMTMVALGSDQPDIEKLVSIRTSAQLAQFKHDTPSIKQASTVAYNYNAKDTYTAVADPKAGFSSSDVALLKTNVQNAPIVPIESGQVVQNESIVVMGFPGNADNPLTDNQQAAVTVTDGVVSSIREAAGGRGKLYQSDVAASHGN
ncbi:MAG: trypsin-like peptidase domain-containing protein, partial [Candidatus Saccharimonadales bacterium]